MVYGHRSRQACVVVDEQLAVAELHGLFVDLVEVEVFRYAVLLYVRLVPGGPYLFGTVVQLEEVLRRR